MKKFLIRFFAVVCIAFGLTSCLKTQTYVGDYQKLTYNDSENYYPIYTAKQCYLIGGLIPLGRKMPEQAPSDNCAVKTKVKFIDGLVSSVTFGIFSMQTIGIDGVKDLNYRGNGGGGYGNGNGGNVTPATVSAEKKEEAQQMARRALSELEFETGSAKIKESSYQLLDLLANTMILNPTYKLYVSGHTDNVGNKTRNLELSTERAKAVKNYLVLKGVDSDRIEATGYGDSKPMYPNDTPDNRAKNRRVELEIEF